MKIKKGDNIIVITGKDKGKTAKVLDVFAKKSLVLVEGVNMKKRHQKGKTTGKGQVVDKVMPIHISNVKIAGGKNGTRVGFKITGDKKVRISKKTGKEI